MIGWLQASRYASRPTQIRALIHALQRLETEIGYGFTPLPDAIARSAAHVPEPAASLLRSVNRGLADASELSFQESWEEAIAQAWPNTAMRQQEQAAFVRLGHSLGISDRDDQMKHLKLAVQQLQYEEEAARQESARYVKMWRSLGVLSAALIVILIL